MRLRWSGTVCPLSDRMKMEVERVPSLGQMFLRWVAWTCKDHVLVAGALSRHLYIRLNCHRVPGVWQVLKFCISLFLGKLSVDRRVIWGLGSLGSLVLRTEVGDSVSIKAGHNWNPR